MVAGCTFQGCTKAAKVKNKKHLKSPLLRFRGGLTIFMIDLRSDTVTRPSEGMLQAMLAAKVGDDVFYEDETVRLLEEQAAAMFGKEVALFCPSGTMCNQIALKLHTQPLDEVIAHDYSHIQQYESAGFAFFSGIKLCLTTGDSGKVRADEIAPNIKPNFDWLPTTRLVWIENTCNKAGGSCYTLAELQAIRQKCTQHNLGLHLDGARIFNAIAATGITPLEIGSLFDSLNFCLSKGLGCPVGSLIVGNTHFIKQARRLRKVMGGGMRQVGFLAAAGIYALQNNLDRLTNDHKRAKILADAFAAQPYITHVLPCETNIVMLHVSPNYGADRLVQQLAQHDIKTISLANNQIRLVTHLDFTDNMLEKVLKVIKS